MGATSILYDQRMLIEMNEKFYKTSARSNIFYLIQCWESKNNMLIK